MASPDLPTLPDLPPAIQDNTPKTLSVEDKSSEDGGDSCRICRGEASDEQPLFYPCKCSGSIRFVHQECLMEWLAHSKKKYCELCKTPFRFTKLYDKTMPAVLPIPLFLHQLGLHLFEAVTRWSRYILVAAIWCLCLPWCIRQVWRGLFWLADGSWLSEAHSNQADPRQLNMTLSEWNQFNSTFDRSTNVSFIDSLQNTTFKDAETARANETIISMTLRYVSGESLVSKIFRVLFSIPPLHFGRPSQSSQTQLFSGKRPLQRPPSLLSDVKAVKALSLSPFVNHVTLDVLEGILVCLALVAGFILIFLIREWVINQQPMLNIPDPELVENAPPAVAPIADGRPIIRPRRRRIVPRVVDQAPRPGGDVNRPNPHFIPAPPRRVLTDDNIGVPVAPDFNRPRFPVRSQSLVEGWPRAQLDEPEGSSPPPLLRGAIGEAVNVHRAIEEAPISEDGRELHPARLLDAGTNDLMPSSQQLYNANEIPAGPARRPSTPVVRFETEVDVIEPESDCSSLVLSSDSEASNDSEPLLVPTPDSENTNLNGSQYDSSDSSDSEVPLLDRNNSPDQESQAAYEQAVTENTVIVGTDDDTTIDEVEVASAVAEASISGDEELPTEPNNPEEQQPTHSSAQRLADWLWHVEGPVPATSPLDAQQEDQLFADLRAEAPFVPGHDQGIDAQQNVFAAEVRQPNLEQALLPPDAQNIDWNDPNAADEIEDLEGVLELIGMEGPLVGMIQNVVFSLFLITITLTGSIWIPYIWGKITLLLIANPVVVLIKAPMFLISNLADLIADLVFFVLGLLGLLFNSVTKVVKASTAVIYPSFSNLLDTDLFEQLALNATHQSGSRLEKTLTATAMTLSPDLPAFSIQSHRALVTFKSTLITAGGFVSTSCAGIYNSLAWPTLSVSNAQHHFHSLVNATKTLPESISNLQNITTEAMQDAFSVQMKSLAVDVTSPENIELVEWNTEDKIIAVIMGYIFFAVLGYVFLKAAHLVLGLGKDEKVEGPVADGLRQAGGVLKVIVIIGIEMIVFPLYCGLLLDVATLPLFNGATIQSRLAFIRAAPFTGLFLHWFVGTCYMFHFALFVSICRKILRKGVLYFIRDPDDPTFHPVRDVLERPVPTQLGKIAFSALVYGGLVILCLGGVVWGVGRIDGVLPIRWSTPEPRLAFPLDVLFFNFMLPFVVRRVEPSKKLSTVYEWWFRGCAHGLRLTQFLFGDEREDEKMTRLPWRLFGAPNQLDGTYVRGPASDSCRIPKGRKVFLEVNEKNERLDGMPDSDKGLYGKDDGKWMKLYLPPQFRARVATFVVLLWLFAAGTGVASTIGPLLLGRAAMKWMAGSSEPVNDLYAFTMGAHILGASVYALANVRRVAGWLKTKPVKLLTNFRQTWPRLWSALQYAMGIAYITVAFGLVFPFALSLIAELYVYIPLVSVLLSKEKQSPELVLPETPVRPFPHFGPTVFLLQTWTLGLLHLRVAFRVALRYPSPQAKLATAIRKVFQDGYLQPDVRLASRAIILPLTGLCIVLLGVPVVHAKILITIMRVTDPATKMWVYRMAFPGVLGLAAIAYGMMAMKLRLEIWRVKVRDEVYLVGERLHNYVDKKERRRKAREKAKGKEKAA